MLLGAAAKALLDRTAAGTRVAEQAIFMDGHPPVTSQT